MLLPNRTKHRKVRKGRIRGVATAGNYIAFGVSRPARSRLPVRQ
jgi:ribosomal protein L16/L10AE